MSKKPSKSETLTIRLDPKSRFMLDFVSRLRGQSITTVVERAISEAANAAKISQPDYEPHLTWRDFWSVIEGERAVKIARQELLHPTYEEERRLKFAEQFWQFFFTSHSKEVIRTGYVEVLWPRIDEFIELYDSTKQTDYFAAGEAMKKALSAARLATPEWPEVAKPKAEAPKSGGNFSRDLDDDIPF